MREGNEENIAKGDDDGDEISGGGLRARSGHGRERVFARRLGSVGMGIAVNIVFLIHITRVGGVQANPTFQR